MVPALSRLSLGWILGFSKWRRVSKTVQPETQGSQVQFKKKHTSQPNAWRLLHYAGKGGARFSVGSTSRYPPGQEADAAHKAKEYQIEARRKIYFCDAWRSQPELGTRGSDLHDSTAKLSHVTCARQHRTI